jgi:hypothetical protein
MCTGLLYGVSMYHKLLNNPKNVKFKDLLDICINNFGDYRIRGDHFIFNTPWAGDPYVNIQPDKKNKKMAKPYQVKQINKALIKLYGGNYGDDR